MEIRINLNERVKFKLSERGKEIYRHRYDGYGFEYDREPKLDDDGYMSMQLWVFMQTFGEHMIMGMSEVVQPLEIIYEQENAPLVEPKEIIRCKNCRHDNNCDIQYAAQAGNGFFCGLAERKEDMLPVEPKRPKGDRTMRKYVELEDVIQRLDNAIYCVNEGDFGHDEALKRLRIAYSETMPTIEVSDDYISKRKMKSERPKEEWIFNPKDAIDSMFTKPKCSECGFESANGGNFCSNCGADMRGEVK